MSPTDCYKSRTQHAEFYYHKIRIILFADYYYNMIIHARETCCICISIVYILFTVFISDIATKKIDKIAKYFNGNRKTGFWDTPRASALLYKIAQLFWPLSKKKNANCCRRSSLIYLQCLKEHQTVTLEAYMSTNNLQVLPIITLRK